MSKQIGITLEQHIVMSTRQHHRDFGPPETVDVEVGRYYEVTSMRNAAVVEWDNKTKIRVGDQLTEEMADAVARCKVFDVTIKT